MSDVKPVTILFIGAFFATILARSGACTEETTDLLNLPLESLLQMPVSVASPYEETVQHAASSVAILHPVDWQRRGARSQWEALEQIPDVELLPSLAGAQMIAVRGYATDISTRGIATLLDGVPLNNYSYATSAYELPFVPLSLLERIEMIRGPGSTLYGSDAFHGVVDLHTISPSIHENRLVASGGSYDDGSLAWIGSESGDNLRLSGGAAVTHFGDRHLAYEYSDIDTGQRRHGTRAETSHDDAAFLHLESGRPDVNLWRFSFYGDDYHSLGQPGIGRRLYPPLLSYFKLASISLNGAHDTMGQDSTWWQAQLMHQQQLPGDLVLEVRLFQWRANQEWSFNFQDYPNSMTLQNGITLPCRTDPATIFASPLFCAHTLFQRTDDARRGFHTVLRESQPQGTTQWAFGLGRDWLNVLDSSSRRVAIDGATYLDEQTPVTDAGRRIDYLLFDARTEISGNWSTNYGVRWDDYTDVGQATSPRLGLIYQPDPRWTAKLLYSHAFRAPSAVEQYGTGSSALQLPNPSLKPESIDTVELVGQHQYNWMETEVVLFESRWKDGIILNPLTLTQAQYQNSAKNRSHGIECSLRGSWQRWMLEGNASFVNSANSSSGQGYTAFPRYTINMGAGYQISAQWSLWLNQRTLINRTEAGFLANMSPPHAPDYWRTDLHLGWQQGHYRSALDVRNLTNRQNINPSLYNAEFGLPDEPITIRATAEWQW